MIGIRYYGCSWRGGAVGPVTVNNLHVFIFRSPNDEQFQLTPNPFRHMSSVHPLRSAKIMSTHAILATIAAIGAADVSYCKLSHPGYFLSSAVRGFAFSCLLLHAQGS